ncbi:hypothetical protein [Luteitalea sp.]
METSQIITALVLALLVIAIGIVARRAGGPVIPPAEEHPAPDPRRPRHRADR